MNISIGQRIRSGGVKMTVIATQAPPDSHPLAHVKVGWFNSMAEAVESTNMQFWRPFSWVQEKMNADAILDS